MEDDATNVTLMGAGVNGLMGISKLLAGLQVNSAALVADAAHSLSDLVSDAVTLMTLKVSKLRQILSILLAMVAMSRSAPYAYPVF